LNGLDLISSSMRLIGALASGETASSAEAADALMVLQQMLDSWLADRLMAFTININEFPLTSGQQNYTMGTGGNFNVARPANIDRVSIVSLTNPAQPLELQIDMYTDEDWQAIPVKVITSPLPQGVYEDGGFPLRTLSFWPIPSATSKTRIYSWSPLTTFPDLVTDITFPPGYLEALRYNLALRLIAEMPGKYNPIMVSTTLQLANESLARIKSMNLPMIEAHIDQTLTGQGDHYNYYSDSPAGRGR
jgi:hypothetical protein